MRFVLHLIVLFGLSGVQQGIGDNSEACAFRISAEQIRPQIVAAADVLERAAVMPQPDSPLAIVRADLTEMRLFVGSGFYDRSGGYTLDVKNVSDQAIVEAQVMVTVGRFGSGIGSGHRLDRMLNPGERARIAWKGGQGQSTGGSNEPAVVVLVDHVKTRACVYKPSQRWPSLRTADTEQSPAVHIGIHVQRTALGVQPARQRP